MKRWTVVLIPHARGGTRTLTLSSLHFHALVALLMCLSFSSAFFYQRHQAIAEKAQSVHELNRHLELEMARKPEVSNGLDDEARRKLEADLRSAYETNIATITTELQQLYELEAEIRTQTKLEPRRPSIIETAARGEGGRGGAVSTLGNVFAGEVNELLRPHSVIDGMTRPSADQLLHEIQLRIASYEDLSARLETRRQDMERRPAIVPVRNARRTSGFGYRRDPFTRRLTHHAGIDLAAPTGTPVRATAYGTVVSSTYDRDYGNVIRIRHGNGLETLYAHLSERLVKDGDTVNRNDLIGKVGSTGRSTGPHLHYEVRLNGKPINPAPYMGGE